MKKVKGLKICNNIKKHEFIKGGNKYLHNDLLNRQLISMSTLSVFEELSDNNSIHRKLAIETLIYKLIILTVELYDFDTCTTILLTT